MPTASVTEALNAVVVPTIAVVGVIALTTGAVVSAPDDTTVTVVVAPVPTFPAASPHKTYIECDPVLSNVAEYVAFPSESVIAYGLPPSKSVQLVTATSSLYVTESSVTTLAVTDVGVTDPTVGEVVSALVPETVNVILDAVPLFPAASTAITVTV